MGRITGFMEYPRIEEEHLPVQRRIKDHREFVLTLEDDKARIQSARCMDCGTPFCNNGCPVNNIIPDFNDLVFRGDWENAIAVLHSTNNFPEFTGRICPAPCEAACTLNVNDDAVGIKSIEHAIIDKAWANDWVKPVKAHHRSGKTVAIVGSGPAGMAAAQQLARAGHDVTVFEKNDRVGGLLRYGIPDFKLEKAHIDRRITQMQAEGVVFRTGVLVGDLPKASKVTNWARESISAEQLQQDFDAVVLAGGAEQSRDLPVPGRELKGVHFAMEFLPQQNKVNAGDKVRDQLRADGKHVIVIGGGDTGSDCVGTSNRHGAKSVTQFELMAQPPIEENRPLTWPYWPIKLRTSSSHEEGCAREFAISTKEIVGEKGKVKRARRVEGRQDGRDAGDRAGASRRSGAVGDGIRVARSKRARCVWCGQGRTRQCAGQHRVNPWVCDQCCQGVCRRRHAARPEPGGLGDSGRSPGRARRGRISDGIEPLAALIAGLLPRLCSPWCWVL